MTDKTTVSPATVAAWETQVDRLRQAMNKLNQTREQALAARRLAQEVVIATEIVITNMEEDLDQLRETLEIHRQVSARAEVVAGGMDDIGDDFGSLWEAAIEHVIERAESDIVEQNPARLRDAIEGALGKTLRSVLASITATKRNEILRILVDGLIDGPG